MLALSVSLQVFVLSDELVLKQTMQQSLINVTYLNLHGNGIRKLEYLKDLVNLKVLVASFNEISKVEGVSDLRKLERLELGYNQIKRCGPGMTNINKARGQGPVVQPRHFLRLVLGTRCMFCTLLMLVVAAHLV